jgi:hypothetical protein
MNARWRVTKVRSFLALRRIGVLRKLRVLSAITTVMFVAVPISLGVQTWTTQEASASSVCYNAYKYGGYETGDVMEGVEGDIDASSSKMSVSDSDTDHAALWIGSNSQADSGQTPYSADWIQAGYFVGAVNGIQTSSVEVYSEYVDPDTTYADDELFPSYGTGNHYFSVYYTGETGMGGRGLYGAYYSLSYDLLAESYLIDPSDSLQEVNSEAEAGSSSSACPKFTSGLIGTNGDSSPGYSSSTIVNVLDPGHDDWISFTPTNVTLTNITDSPYSLDVYSSDDAFGVSGGG